MSQGHKLINAILCAGRVGTGVNNVKDLIYNQGWPPDIEAFEARWRDRNARRKERQRGADARYKASDAKVGLGRYADATEDQFEDATKQHIAGHGSWATLLILGLSLRDQGAILGALRVPGCPIPEIILLAEYNRTASSNIVAKEWGLKRGAVLKKLEFLGVRRTKAEYDQTRGQRRRVCIAAKAQQNEAWKIERDTRREVIAAERQRLGEERIAARMLRLTSRKIKVRMRTRLYNNLFSNQRPRDNPYGCSMAELRAWIKAKWKRGMTWENHATVWELDHVRPLSSFDLTKPEERLKAHHFTNIQPLYGRENRAKAGRWTGQQTLAI